MEGAWESGRCARALMHDGRRRRESFWPGGGLPCLPLAAPRLPAMPPHPHPGLCVEGLEGAGTPGRQVGGGGCWHPDLPGAGKTMAPGPPFARLEHSRQGEARWISLCFCGD